MLCSVYLVEFTLNTNSMIEIVPELWPSGHFSNPNFNRYKPQSINQWSIIWLQQDSEYTRRQAESKLDSLLQNSDSGDENRMIRILKQRLSGLKEQLEQRDQQLLETQSKLEMQNTGNQSGESSIEQGWASYVCVLHGTSVLYGRSVSWVKFSNVKNDTR